MTVCKECGGTGEYRGLNTVEPCKACRGFGNFSSFAKAVIGLSVDLKDSPSETSLIPPSKLTFHLTDTARVVSKKTGVSLSNVKCNAPSEILVHLLETRSLFDIDIKFPDDTELQYERLQINSWSGNADGTQNLELLFETELLIGMERLGKHA